MWASLKAARNADPRWPDVPNATRCAGSDGSGRISSYARRRAATSTRSDGRAGWPARGCWVIAGRVAQAAAGRARRRTIPVRTGPGDGHRGPRSPAAASVPTAYVAPAWAPAGRACDAHSVAPRAAGMRGKPRAQAERSSGALPLQACFVCTSSDAAPSNVRVRRCGTRRPGREDVTAQYRARSRGRRGRCAAASAGRPIAYDAATRASTSYGARPSPSLVDGRMQEPAMTSGRDGGSAWRP